MNLYYRKMLYSYILIYSLCVSLSQDLQEEFYEFYSSLLFAILKLSQRKDSHVLDVR